MKVKASVKMVRISPRKVRLILDEVRGLSVADAERVLQFMTKKGAEPVLKLIRSAAANAVNNFDMDRDSLKIVTLTANEGPTIKRYMPRAFGRATQIRKRTSHLEVELAADGVATTETAAAKKETVQPATTKKAIAKKPATKKAPAKKTAKKAAGTKKETK